MSKMSLLLILSLVVFNASAAAETASNVALGKKYTLFPKPNYRHCTDPEDDVQLTDGKTTSGYFWTQKGTVGWQNVPYAVAQIDLGQVEPVSGIDVTTAAGVAGVYPPMEVLVHVSEDGNTFRHAADLVSLDSKSKGPWPKGYAIRCLEGRNLTVRGRFVRVVMISTGTYLFTDEIRVYRGDDALLSGEPRGEIVERDVKALCENERVRYMIKRRFDMDIAAIRDLYDKTATMTGDEKKRAAQKIDAIEKRAAEAIETKSFPGQDRQATRTFRTVFPYTDFHAGLFRLQGDVWKAAGMRLHAVPVSPWEKTPLFGVPEKKDLESNRKIEINAMQGEYRAAAFNLYNATEEPVPVSIRLDGIPASEITVHDVPWTDTTQLEPVLAALPPAAGTNGLYTVDVLPGLVKQVCLTFRPTNLEPKLHEARLVVQAANDSKAIADIPLSLKVWPMKFPEKTSLLVGGWSYTNGNGAYSVNPKNRDSFLRHLQERFVNAPWARPSVVMNFEFDKETGAAKPDTQEMDAWLAQWPDAEEYCIFLSVGTSIKGTKIDAPEFERRVGRWIGAWVEHWKNKGIEPERINLLVADEPGLDYALDALYAWSRAIRKAEPKLKLWTDPVYSDPSKAPPEVFEVADVLCPNRPQWIGNRKGFDTFYVDGWKNRGKTLQLYSCSGPARLLDPYSYYRLQAWDVARIGGTGSFFWAFGDGNGVSSWNEYDSARNMYTPLFIDPDDEQVVAGKQMEAIREGIEDYETIRMLQKIIETRKNGGKPTGQAETVLREAFDNVLKAENVDTIFWHEAKDRTVADRERVKLLEMIERLSAD